MSIHTVAHTVNDVLIFFATIWKNIANRADRKASRFRTRTDIRKNQRFATSWRKKNNSSPTASKRSTDPTIYRDTVYITVRGLPIFFFYFIYFFSKLGLRIADPCSRPRSFTFPSHWLPCGYFSNDFRGRLPPRGPTPGLSPFFLG